jgi:hypothetical protein
MITEREESAGKPTNGESKLPNGKTMTRDNIIRMAREAGFTTLSINEDLWGPYLERFAALVAAHEREACAMECIKVAHGWTRLGAWGENQQAHDCAAAIRARGEK